MNNIDKTCRIEKLFKGINDVILHNSDIINNKLTEEDVDTIKYFWLEKGDLTRWVDWEKKLPLIKKQYPELIDAIERYEIAIKTLTAVVRGLE